MAKKTKVDTQTSTATHGPNDAVGAPDADATGAVTEERASAYQSDHFVVRFEGASALISPINWVGPAPLVVPADRLKELAELLHEAL